MTKILLTLTVSLLLAPVFATAQDPNRPPDGADSTIVRLKQATTTVIDGGHGQIDFTSPLSFNLTSVLLQSAASWPSIVAKLGTSDASSSFAVYSSSNVPLFTVSGNGDVSAGGAPIAGVALGAQRSTPGSAYIDIRNLHPSGNAVLQAVSGDSNASPRNAFVSLYANESSPQHWLIGMYGTKRFVIRDNTVGVNRVAVDTNGRIGIGTETPVGLLDLRDTTQRASRLVFSGQEYYQAGAGTGPGVSLLLGVNRTGNKQLWIADADDVTAGGTHTVIRTLVGSNTAVLDAIGSDGTPRLLQLGNTGGMTLSASGGNVGIGTSSPSYALDVNGTTRVTGVLFTTGAVGVGAAPAANLKLDVAGDARFTGTVTGGNIRAKYQDIAEWVPSDADLEPGTVVVLDEQQANRVIRSATAYDTRVAGVISTQPGLSLGESGEGKSLVATTGRVRVKVDARTAAIKIGDLLVTSDTPGMAMRSEPVQLGGRKFHQPGTIVGKALEPIGSGTGEILVLLAMQ